MEEVDPNNAVEGIPPPDLSAEHFISDNQLATFVSNNVKPNYRKHFKLKKLMAQEDDVKAPPYYFNGENTNPLHLPRLLYPERESDSMVVIDGDFAPVFVANEVVQAKGIKGITRKDLKKETLYGKLKPVFQSICQVLIDDFKAIANLDIDYNTSNPQKQNLIKNGLTTLQQTRIQPNKPVVFYCNRCCNKEEGKYTRVAEGRFQVEEKDNNYKCMLVLNEVWFHDLHCLPTDEKVPLKDKGFDIIPPPKNSKLEELRKLAYGDWLNILNECQDPGAELPHGKLIGFEMAKVIKRDNRSQIKLGRPGAVPEGVNSEHHMRYSAWQLYRMICGNNLTKEWTTYRHHPNIKGDPNLADKVISTQTITHLLPSDPERPVHLYVNNIYILFGGMQLAKDGNGLLPLGQEPYLHQMAHGDFSSPIFEPQQPTGGSDSSTDSITDEEEEEPVDPNEEYLDAKDSCLLKGLNHPCTYNVAIETERSMWVNTISNVCTVKNNGILAISADTVHGGIHWNANEQKKIDGKYLYKPSLHFVMQSVRYPQLKNTVKLAVSPKTYCPTEHMDYLDASDQLAEFHASHQKIIEMVTAIDKNPNKSKFPKVSQELLAKCKVLMKNEPKKRKKKLHTFVAAVSQFGPMVDEAVSPAYFDDPMAHGNGEGNGTPLEPSGSDFFYSKPAAKDSVAKGKRKRKGKPKPSCYTCSIGVGLQQGELPEQEFQSYACWMGQSWRCVLV
jgi:hypothetical protein